MVALPNVDVDGGSAWHETSHHCGLGLLDAAVDEEPLLRHGLEQEFTLDDNEFHPTVGARELPIFRVAGPNAASSPVFNHQGTALGYGAGGSRRNHDVTLLPIICCRIRHNDFTLRAGQRCRLIDRCVPCSSHSVTDPHSSNWRLG